MLHSWGRRNPCCPRVRVRHDPCAPLPGGLPLPKLKREAAAAGPTAAAKWPAATEGAAKAAEGEPALLAACMGV
jgi:hypothetical protein